MCPNQNRRSFARPGFEKQRPKEFRISRPRVDNHAGQPTSPEELAAADGIFRYCGVNPGFVDHHPKVVLVRHGGEDLSPHSKRRHTVVISLFNLG
jgi:hypothetical protein